MGACTVPFGVNRNDTGVLGPKRSVGAIIAPSTSYATGGDSIDPKLLGLKVIDNLYLNAERGVTTNPGFNIRLAGTPEAPKIQFFDANATEVTAATNLSARTFIATFTGS